MYAPLIFHWGKQQGLTATDAADLVQEVLAVLVAKLPQFEYDPRHRFRGWLKKITVHRASDFHRRNAIRSAESLDEAVHGVGVARQVDLFEEAEYRVFLVRRAAEVMQAEFGATSWQACWRYIAEDGDVPFIAMQYLRGESLQKRLAREGRLPQRDVLRIGREVAAGLQAAHEHGLIHRDIRPDNIWLDAKTGWAKILDFGLVRAIADDADLTHSGMVQGTPLYMAPEQAQGQPLDHRGDLFSLGSVLYHLAAGRPAFEGGNLTAVLIAVAQANPPEIAALAADLDPELARLIMRLLSKDPGQRPPSAAEVAESLARTERRLDAAPAGHEPTATVARTIAPTPPQAKPHGGNGRKLTGRRIVVAAGGLAAALLLGVIIITITNKDGTNECRRGWRPK